MTEMPASPQGPQGDPVAAEPGPLLDRFLARLIDFVLLFIVNAFIVGLLVVGAIMGDSGNMFRAEGTAANAVSAIISTALYLVYFVYLESSRGQTLGKMAMKLHTRGPDGGHPTMEQALRRNGWLALGFLAAIPFVAILSGLAELVVVILIAVQINGDPQRRQGWHDRFAGGTTVVKQG